MRTRFGPSDEVDPFLNQRLSRLVCGMGFAGQDKLHGPIWIGEQAKQPLRVVQQKVRPLVGCKAPRKAQRQGVGIKEMFRLINGLGRCAGGGQLLGQSFAGVFHERLGCRRYEIARAWRRRRGGCLALRFFSFPASGLFRKPPSKDHRPAAESQVGM